MNSIALYVCWRFMLCYSAENKGNVDRSAVVVVLGQPARARLGRRSGTD